MNKKPNIVFLMTDEQRFDAVGYANAQVHTPNLDRLAAQSVRFDNAYTPNPSCIPARVHLHRSIPVAVRRALLHLSLIHI